MPRGRMLHADNHACGGCDGRVVLFMLSCLLHRVCATRLPPPASTSPALHLGCLYVFFVVERGRPCPGGRCCTLATVPEWVLFVIHCVAFLLHRVCATRPPPPRHRLFCILNIYIYLSWWSEVGIAPGSNVACCQRCWWWVSFFIYCV